MTQDKPDGKVGGSARPEEVVSAILSQGRGRRIGNPPDRPDKTGWCNVKRLPFLVLALLLLVGCGKKQAPAPTKAADPAQISAAASDKAPTRPAYDKSQLAVFAPLPATMVSADNPLSAAKIALGKMLYFDKRLSKNHDVSCNSCHDIGKYGVDGQPTSTGHRGQKGGRNAPTVYNAAGHLAQFWDGRAATVEEQAKGPVLNPIEMALPDAAAAERVLRSIPGYAAAFALAFPEAGQASVTFDNFAQAVGAYERTLVTPSRWDRLLGGDEGALTDPEKQGLALFHATGCIACHNGAYLGGSSYQKLGAVKPWPRPVDDGRGAISKAPADMGKFKVPSLRNIAETGPYFHDGQTAELKEAVILMARHQLGKELSDADAAAIVVWLGALTGALPKDANTQPTLPPSGPDTPAADAN